MKKFMSKIAHWESGEYVYRIYRCRELVLGYITVESSGNDHRHYVVFPGHPIKIELVTTYAKGKLRHRLRTQEKIRNQDLV